VDRSAPEIADFSSWGDKSLRGMRRGRWRTGRPRARAPSIAGNSDRCPAGSPGPNLDQHDQGVSHAKWPEDDEAQAPTQTGGGLCCPLKAVDVGRNSPRAERLARRAPKLRAISRASPDGSSVRRRRRGGELLPARRTLFQVDVLGLLRSPTVEGRPGRRPAPAMLRLP